VLVWGYERPTCRVQTDCYDCQVQEAFLKRVTLPWLLACLLIASANATARADDSPKVDTSEEKAEKGDLTEINKQLTNPVSELWSITFQQNNFRISPGIPFDQGERWTSFSPSCRLR
jgi:hypothetical protein